MTLLKFAAGQKQGARDHHLVAASAHQFFSASSCCGSVSSSGLAYGVDVKRQACTLPSPLPPQSLSTLHVGATPLPPGAAEGDSVCVNSTSFGTSQASTWNTLRPVTVWDFALLGIVLPAHSWAVLGCCNAGGTVNLGLWIMDQVWWTSMPPMRPAQDSRAPLPSRLRNDQRSRLCPKLPRDPH